MCSKTNWQHICSQWRLWIRPLLLLLYVIFAIIIVPVLIYYTVKDGFSRKDQLVLVAGLLVLTAVPISVWHITQHVIHFTKPILQKHIIRILWMVPIYALNAWIGLLIPEKSVYVDSLRECYEAYVIYNFMVYLLNYLNLGMDLEATLEHKPQVKHIFPLCCMRPWKMGHEFIHNCKHGILQYTIVRPITTFVSVICELCNVYGEGSFKTNVAFPYIIFVNNISQFVAMYCLVLFYKANKMDLKPMRPIPKFLCIKAVIFFSFFQGVIIYFLVYYGLIKDIFGSGTNPNDFKGLASELQNFLICIEMFLAAIAHIYSFPHKPYHINAPQYWNVHANWCDAFLSMLDITDVQEDVTEHLGVVSSSLSRRFRGLNNYNVPRGGTESSYLIPPTPNSTYQTGINMGNENSISNTLITNKGYGSLNNTTTPMATTSSMARNQTSVKTPNLINIGIDIKQKEHKEVSSRYGAPPTSAINYLKYANSYNIGDIEDDSSSISTKHDTSSKSESNSISFNNGTISGTNGERGDGYDGGGKIEDVNNLIKKSDSDASNWLSTPTDELIDVKGVEKDNITIHPDPKV